MDSVRGLRVCLDCGTYWTLAAPEFCPLCHSLKVTTVEALPAANARPAPPPRPPGRVLDFTPSGPGDPPASGA